MPKSKYMPFFCASIVMHIALGGILFFSSARRPKPKLCSFKEQIIRLPMEPKSTGQMQTFRSSSSHQEPLPPSPQKIIKDAPTPTKKNLSKTPGSLFQQKPSGEPQKTAPLTIKKQALEGKQATLKKLAQLANQLAKEAESQESQIAQLSWPTRVEVCTEISSCQQETFSALFQQYVCLPFPGEVRLKLEFSIEGALLNCSVLSTISPTDKQHILKQIQQIPFQSFFNTYKLSKNMVFHIRLQGNSA